MQYDDRTFDESEKYATQQRLVTGMTVNRVWLYTVDVATDTENGKSVIQLVRWRARRRGERRRQKFWQRWRFYNIRSIQQWESASRAVDAAIQESSLEVDPSFVRLERSSSDEQSLGDQVSELQERLVEVSAAKRLHLAERRRAEQRLREMKRHVSAYRTVLTQFQRLVNGRATTETMVHEFIEREKPFWMFGLEYAGLESRVAFPPRSRKFEFDLMLQRVDGFQDLVELKGPNKSLFDRRTPRRSKLNVSLSEALGQAFTYLNECDRHPGYRLFKPKAILVIGNKHTDNPKQRKLLASHLARIDVLTYSELLAHGSKLLEHLEAGP